MTEHDGGEQLYYDNNTDHRHADSDGLRSDASNNLSMTWKASHPVFRRTNKKSTHIYAIASHIEALAALPDLILLQSGPLEICNAGDSCPKQHGRRPGCSLMYSDATVDQAIQRTANGTHGIAEERPS